MMKMVMKMGQMRNDDVRVGGGGSITIPSRPPYRRRRCGILRLAALALNLAQVPGSLPVP